jgi:hypothetical protein
VSTTFRSAATAFADLVHAIPESGWDGTGLGDWDLRALVGHASRSLITVSTYLRAPADRELGDESRGSAAGGVYDLPYTGMTAPRVTVFSGDARNRIVAATSSTLGQDAKSAFGIAWRLSGVSKMEGATALTRMSSCASSAARAVVSAATPALAIV